MGVLACTAALCLGLTATAQAVPDCRTPLPAPVQLYKGNSLLEAAIVDNQGHLYFSNAGQNSLWRMDSPNSVPYVFQTGLPNTGGLAFDADQSHILVGIGDGFVGGLLGNIKPAAKILSIDVHTHAVTTAASGLRMANGVARASDGTLFASSDVGLGIDRVSPSGVTQNNWATVISSNGLAIDPGEHWLYVNQTFVPAAIMRIPLDHPGPPEVYARPGLLDIAAGLDGLTMDPLGRPVAAANGGLAIWRVNPDRSICALGRGLLLPSAVAYGHGSTGFSAGHLYAVTFSGGVYEIPAGFVAP
jgi:sugar lactone lactonase YvrE